MRQLKCLILLVTAGISAFSVSAQVGRPKGASGPEANLSLVLGRPTDRSITLSVLSASDIQASVEYGTRTGTYAATTGVRTIRAGVPVEFEIALLTPDTRYYYRLLARKPGTGESQPQQEAEFHAQRSPGSAFAFAVQGDSHPEREGKMYDPALYVRTLRNVAKEAPDFYLTLGDDFSIERLIDRHTLSQAAVDQVYAQQRTFLGVVGRSSSLFLVNGNHEQAALCNLDGTPDNAAVMAGRALTRFFPLPAPDTFYGGNAEESKSVGLLRDYYSWTWGDALFVVIDFYWHSQIAVDGRADGQKRDLWAVTLGEAQYRCLAKTLTESKARWKFVFCHHVLGTGRGGIECASLCEWGGRSRNGEWEFGRKRPGWELPIHQLMVKTGVTVFFQGHDHLFVRQELDGVVYQSCPNPADSTYQAFNREAYRSGDVLPNSGHLRVKVSPQEVGVDYMRSWLPTDEAAGHTNGETAFHYSIRAGERAP
jgi:hypothetical protein